MKDIQISFIYVTFCVIQSCWREASFPSSDRHGEAEAGLWRCSVDACWSHRRAIELKCVKGTGTNKTPRFKFVSVFVAVSFYGRREWCGSFL